MADLPHCPICGYTQEDEMIHCDHYLCKGKIPGENSPKKTEPALKPCPFCGSTSLDYEDDAPQNYISCNGCKITWNWCADLPDCEAGFEEAAKRKWNTRFPPQGPLVMKDGTPMPIYPVPDDNLYKISYKYVENPSEISPWKPTVEQLQHLIDKYQAVRFHRSAEDSLELCIFKWALAQYEKGLL